MRTSRPVSSATSRRAVCSSRLARVRRALRQRPGPAVTSRRRLPTTNWGIPSSYRTTMPPAEVAVAFLRRATAPRRRSEVGAVPGRPERAQCIDDHGRGGRPVDVGAAGRLDGAPARAELDERRESGPPEHGRPRRGGAGTCRWRGGRAAARGPATTGGRNAPPAAPRTWRRCCAAWAQSYRFRPACKRSPRGVRAARSGVSAPRASASAISRSRPRDRAAATSGAWARERREVRVERPASPRVNGPVRAARIPRAWALPSVCSTSGR